MRHAYWSACMTVALGEDQAARFATAHEVPVDRLSGEEAMLAGMDLFNNEVGRTIGLAYVEGLSAAGESAPRRLDAATREELWDAVTWARIRGDLKAVRIDPDGTAHLVTTDDPLAF